MATVRFTKNLQRHVSCPPCEVAGGTVREALDAAFAINETARGYVLDDQGAIRRHVAVFIDGRAVQDREALSDLVRPDSKIDVMQALSGG